MNRIASEFSVYKNKIVFWFKVQSCLFRLSRYLENGVFRIKKQGKKYSIKKSLPRGGGTFLVLSTRKCSSIYSEADLLITSVEKKYIFHIGAELFSFYDKRSSWKQYFQNMDNNLSDLVYPYNPIKSLDYKLRIKRELFICSNEENHMNGDEYARFLLSLGTKANKKRDSIVHLFLTSSQREYDDVIFYVQHGDAHDRNVVYSNGKPVFIDLDDVNLYPALYDFFRFAILDDDVLRAFIERKYDNVICRVLERDIDYPLIERDKDVYFSLFVLVFPDDPRSDHIQMLPSSYSLSRSVYNKKWNCHA